jgi:hypothetical protein
MINKKMEELKASASSSRRDVPMAKASKLFYLTPHKAKQKREHAISFVSMFKVENINLH